MSTPDRRAMLERDHPTVSIRGQCRLLGLARSGVGAGAWRLPEEYEEVAPGERLGSEVAQVQPHDEEVVLDRFPVERQLSADAEDSPRPTVDASRHASARAPTWSAESLS